MARQIRAPTVPPPREPIKIFDTAFSQITGNTLGTRCTPRWPHVVIMIGTVVVVMVGPLSFALFTLLVILLVYLYLNLKTFIGALVFLLF